MSSEEMRVELESFVNEGLKKGWCGWPTKGLSSGARESGRTCCPMSMMPMLSGSMRRQDLFLGGGNSWSGQALVSPERSCDVGGRSPDTGLAPGFGESRPFLRRCW